MPFNGIIMESNFYKACLRPMGAETPTYSVGSLCPTEGTRY